MTTKTSTDEIPYAEIGEVKLAVPGILSKIAKIQEAVGYIPKNGIGPSQKGSFAYVKFDDILEGVRKQLIENNVVTRFNTLEHNVRAEQVGNRMVVNTSVLVEYTYIDIEDGSEHVSVVGGEGSDIGGDTATRKAYSQALKVNLLHTFNIVTGDEPDSDGAEQAELPAVKAEKAPTKTEQNLAEVRAEISQIIQAEGSPYTGAVVNELGRELTGKEDADWGASVTDLRKLLKALQGGQLPSEGK